jgi:hypothetical protein
LFEKEEKKEKNLSDKAESFKASWLKYFI